MNKVQERGGAMPKIIENVRENLILEGKKMLLNKSYKDLSIREIAKNCGIGTGTFYNYFSTKDELVSEIFREDWSKVSDLVNNLKYLDESCKEKFRKIYISLETFVSNYLSIFYEIAMLKGYSYECKEANRFDALYSGISELIDIERARGNIKSGLSSPKLAQFIVSNLIYLNKNKYMSFDELYDSLKL